VGQIKNRVILSAVERSHTSCRTVAAKSLLRCLPFLVALFLASRSFAADPVLPAWSPAVQETWWNAQSSPLDPAAAAAGLREGIAHSFPGTVQLQGALPADAAGWIHLAHLLQAWSEIPSKDREGTIDTLRAVSARPEVAWLLSREIRPSDRIDRALGILDRLGKLPNDPMKTLPALAVAYAVVFDVPFPDGWPHHQVPKKNLPTTTETVEQRFGYYAALDARSKLVFRMRDLSVAQLKFVIDSQTPLTEFDWARDEVRFPSSGADKLFSMIKYDEPRYLKGQYSWPWKDSYTLENIQKAGGICVDQAYFANAVGKANGIPTLYFSGQGQSGGHAWFGYLKKGKRWDLDVGRYATQNYPVGNARDPQSWSILNDSELLQMSEDVLDRPAYPDAQLALVWANLQEDSSGLKKAQFDRARALLPAWILPWREEAIFLITSKAPLPEQKAFAEAWVAGFARDPDLKLEGQTMQQGVLKEMGDTAGADTVLLAIQQQNRRKRFDLGIGAGSGRVLDLLEKKDWQGADQEFKKLVRKFDDKGGGNLFYQLVRPYVETCIEMGQGKQAADALDYAEKKMPQQDSSILSIEFKDLRAEIEKKPDEAEAKAP
jgi:hypothetical protein